MRPPALSVGLATLLAAQACHAKGLIKELSFGNSGRLSSDRNTGRIPYFSFYGQPQQPELLSNKVILTPVAPGNQRGAVWADTPLDRTVWEAVVDFRANGPERGSGNFNIWLVAQGARAVGSHSVHTVGKFDGLALVVDAHGGTGGMIRGFLNDGSVDYQQQQNVDRLAFGHCPYSYRNLGRPSTIRLAQTVESLRVEVDGHLCFDTHKARLPYENYLGITAASFDTPDSFEVFSLVVSSDSTVSGEGDAGGRKGFSYSTQQKQPPVQPNNDHNRVKQPPAAGEIPDAPADQFKTSQAQFEDVHARLQGLMHQVAAVSGSVVDVQRLAEQRHAQSSQTLDALRAAVATADQVGGLAARIKDVEKELRALRDDINSKFSAHHESFQDYLSGHHATLAGIVAESMPSHGKLALGFVAAQLVLVAAYVVYKHRKARSPKKYL